MTVETRHRYTTVVAVSALAVLLTMGIRQSLGLFVPVVSSEFGSGREAISLALAAQSLIFGLPLIPLLADRFGPRNVMAGSSLVFAGGLLVAAGANGPLVFGVGLGLIAGLGLSGASLTVALGAVGRVVPPERRSTVFGFITAAGSIGMLGVVPGVQGLLSKSGWRTTFVAVGVATGALIAAAALLLPRFDATSGTDGPEDALSAVLRRAASTRGYLLLNGGFFVCGFHVAFIATHLPGYVTDNGVDAIVGATALGLIGAFNIAGSFLFGALGDRYRKRTLLSGLYFARAVVMSLFLIVPISTVTVLVFAGAIGFLWLATVPLTSGIVGSLFGSRYLATLYGFVFFSHQIGAFLGVWLGGRVFDVTGSYEPVWVVAVALGVVAAIIHLPIQETPAPVADPVG